MGNLKPIVFLLVFCLLKFLIYTRFNFVNKITFVNVGQGDGIFIRTSKGKTVVIDGGPNYEIDFYVSKHFFLTTCNINVLVLTHPHFDHLLGLNRLLERCKVDNVIYTPVDYKSQAYTDFKRLISHFNVIAPRKGDTFMVDGLALKFIFVQEGLSNNINNYSLVVHLQSGEFDALLMGDLENDVFNKIIQPSISGKLDVFKLSHHGAVNGFSPNLTKLWQIQNCVISVGEKNKYNHPSTDVVNFYQKARCKISRTDKAGSIEFLFK